METVIEISISELGNDIKIEWPSTVKECIALYGLCPEDKIKPEKLFIVHKKTNWVTTQVKR